MRKLFFLLFIISVAKFATAQETENKEFKPKIRGAIMMANSHVPNATEGGKKVAIIPTWGFDVDYFFHPRWSVALQGDIKFQSFEVENDGVVLERTNPIALTAVLHYHASRHWSFYVGPGYEFERHENFFMVKVGTEYSFEITEDFEIALNVMYENKEEVYDAWTFGIAFNKKLWEKK
jgi:outer membrane protein W